MKSTCENLVRDNSDKLFDLIASELTPDEICHEIKACSAKTHDLDVDEAIVVNVVAVPVLGAQVESAKPDPARCTECNKIIVEVQKQVTKDMNLVRIFSLGKFLCSNIHSFARTGSSAESSSRRVR